MNYFLIGDEKSQKVAKELIKEFNTVNSTRWRCNNNDNMCLVMNVLNEIIASNTDTPEMEQLTEDDLIRDFKGALRYYAGSYEKDLWRGLNFIAGTLEEKYISLKDKAEEITPLDSDDVPLDSDDVVKTSDTIVPQLSQVDMTAMVSGIASTVISALGGIDKTSVINEVIKEAKEIIAREYGHIEKKITLNCDNGIKKEINGVLHKKFDDVLTYVNNNIPVYLAGPAGSGKNVLCQQIAEALGLDFYFSNAVTQEYKITGFTDANGTYHESQFYKAFKNGGVFMLDEMDASIPEVLIILNSALANGYFDFPAPIGKVIAHKDFRVVSAGNTYGQGADFEYVGRSQLDSASLDRFAMVRVDYDENIEEDCANGNIELLDFCRKFRKAVQKIGIKMVVSYRSISRMAKLDGKLSTEDLLNGCLIKSLGKDDINLLLPEVSGCGKYTDALRSIAESRA